jgi:Asp/Glu/hydantoin racemase
VRIALIHALRHSAAPVEAAFAALWPEARLMTLMDDSLSSDLARDGVLTPAMTDRFLTLARYAADAGSDGILFTCSAFGPCIDACKAALAPLPVLKPNEAMIEEAVAHGSRIGLLATFAPSLDTLPAEFAAERPGIEVTTALADGALHALDRGDGPAHDRLAAAAAERLAGCDAIALGQFSLARAAAAVAAATGRPVLTTPESAVRKLRRLFGV